VDVRQYDSSQKQTAIIGFEQNPATPSLHAILKKIEHEKGGFSIFRRSASRSFETAECPKALQHFWSGHATQAG